jgi:hypothetical protein
MCIARLSNSQYNRKCVSGRHDACLALEWTNMANVMCVNSVCGYNRWPRLWACWSGGEVVDLHGYHAVESRVAVFAWPNCGVNVACVDGYCNWFYLSPTLCCGSVQVAEALGMLEWGEVVDLHGYHAVEGRVAVLCRA